jgi:ribosomal-protein-alanine N-acetyltransferase
MQVADIEAVWSVEMAAAEFPWGQSLFVSSLQEKDDASLVEVDGNVVGFAIFKPILDESTLLNIAVNPAYQGRGYARALLEQGLKRQAEQGITNCFLEVRESNATAQALYRSVGFVLVGKRKNYYPAKMGREHALLMSCKLPDMIFGEI